MEIKHLHKVNGQSKIKAFFSVETTKITINDMKLIEGKDGQLYAMTPSREYTDKTGAKKYQSIVYISDEFLRDQITQLARTEYFKDESPPANQQSPEDDIPF